MLRIFAKKQKELQNQLDCTKNQLSIREQDIKDLKAELSAAQTRVSILEGQCEDYIKVEHLASNRKKEIETLRKKLNEEKAHAVKQTRRLAAYKMFYGELTEDQFNQYLQGQPKSADVENNEN